MHNVLGPFEGDGALVASLGKGIYGTADIAHRGGVKTPQGSTRQDAEPDLDLVEPGSVGRDVMEVDIGMPSQPPVMLGLMSIKVIQDNVQLLVGVLSDQTVHEVQELTPAPAAIVAYRHRPSGNLQGSEEGGGPVAFVFVAEPAEGPARWACAASPEPAPEPGWRVSHPRSTPPRSPAGPDTRPPHRPLSGRTGGPCSRTNFDDAANESHVSSAPARHSGLERLPMPQRPAALSTCCIPREAVHPASPGCASQCWPCTSEPFRAGPRRSALRSAPPQTSSATPQPAPASDPPPGRSLYWAFHRPPAEPIARAVRLDTEQYGSEPWSPALHALRLST